MNNDIEAEPKRGQDDFDHDAAVARLLARRRKKTLQLLRFKEKQKRQRRWVPLRAAIDWLAEFNQRGERSAPNEALARMRTAELWAVLRGDDVLFLKYQLGGEYLPWCLIEDADPDHAISRFLRTDLSRASWDQRMIRALIRGLWVPRPMLLNLFQEKKWPIAPGLNASSESDSKIAVAPSLKSGLVGRPSSKDLYLKKLKQRALAGELAGSLKEEADFLLGWLKTAHPEHPASGASAIRNLIREDYRQAKSKT